MNSYNITLRKTLLHLWKICIHKYYVARYCFKCGLYWQGITHDLSKLSWTEFWESVRYFQGDSSPINEAKKDKGYSLAWQHHKGRNPHHYEYWTDNYDSGITCIRMPYKYAVELICDWIGAGRAYQGKDFTYANEYRYVYNKLRTAKIHDDTKDFINFIFEHLAMYENDGIKKSFLLNKKTLKIIYQEFNK